MPKQLEQAWQIGKRTMYLQTVGIKETLTL
jgi:hypothetical protein